MYVNISNQMEWDENDTSVDRKRSASSRETDRYVMI